MGLFGEPRVEGEERGKCLAYQDEISKLSWFLNYEIQQFMYTWSQYITCIAVSPTASQFHLGRKAANRLLQATREAIHRHEAMEPVPDAVLELHAAESLFFLRVKEWAEGTVVGAEDLANGLTPDAVEALAKGLLPHQKYLQHLQREYEAAWYRVGRENKRFLKRLRLTPSELLEMSLRDDINRSAQGLPGGWQPEPYTCESSKPEKTPQHT